MSVVSSKKTSYIVGNKKFTAKICVLNLRNKRKGKQLGVYPIFLIFKLLNVSNKDGLSVRKRLLHSAINKRNKELQHVSK